MKVTLIENNLQSHYIIDVVNALVDKDIRLELICSDDLDPSSIDDKVNVINLRGSRKENANLFNKIFRVFKYYFRLFLYTLTTDSKIFHIQWYRFNFFEGIVFNLFFKLMGKKIVYTAHDVLPHNKQNAYNRNIFYLIYHIADHILVHTAFIKQRIQNEFSIKPEKIHVVSFGLYTIAKDTGLTRQQAKEKLQLSADDKVLLFFGNITPYKGLHLLLLALPLCQDKQPDLKLVIAGRLDPSYEEEFESILAKMITDNIVYHPGFVADDDIETYFKACDISVLPYLEASQSAVMFLSYSFGRPVIMPNIGNFPNDVSHGETGYIFHAEDVQDLAHKILLYFSELSEKEAHEQKIKKLTSEKYSWAKNASETYVVYESI